MSFHSGVRRARSALTLVEFLVLLAITLVITAIMIPAVIQARRAARVAQCTSNLRQIGIALQSYAATHQAFPFRGILTARSGLIGHKVHLLPYLGLDALYNAFNTDLGHLAVQNRTVAESSVEVYLCPSDRYAPIGLRSMRYYGWFNYTACVGDGVIRGWNEATGEPHLLKALFSGSIAAQTRLGSCPDGLSMTAAYAEVPHGGRHQTIRHEDPHPVPGLMYVLTANGLDQPALVQRCLAITSPFAGSLQPRNFDWASGVQDMYNHLLPPGAPACMFASVSPGPGQPPRRLFPFEAGALRAGSWHGVTNVLFGDGHVQRFTEQVDLQLWRALGTCSGNENVAF